MEDLSKSPRATGYPTTFFLEGSLVDAFILLLFRSFLLGQDKAFACESCWRNADGWCAAAIPHPDPLPHAAMGCERKRCNPARAGEGEKAAMCHVERLGAVLLEGS
jgi:hypothetical protein